MARDTFPSGQKWGGAGMNYGNERAFNPYFDQTIIKNDLAQIRRYFDKIRIFIPSYIYGVSNPIVLNCIYIIDQAKALGFHVTWGVTSTEDTLTAAKYPLFRAAAIARAQLAEAHGVDRFATNEEDRHVDDTTLTKAQIRDYCLNDIPNAISAVFTGDKSTNYAESDLQDWIPLGKGATDSQGMNAYGENEYTTGRFNRVIDLFHAAYGSTGYISEWNLHYDWTQLTMSQARQRTEVRDRQRHLIALNIDAYFFMYSHVNDDQFACKLADGTYRLFWWELFDGRLPVEYN